MQSKLKPKKKKKVGLWSSSKALENVVAAVKRSEHISILKTALCFDAKSLCC